MFRSATVFAATVAAALLAGPGRAAGDPLPLGETIEGELKAADKKDVNGIALGRLMGVGADFPVKLKAGQSVTAEASVIGKNRQVGLALLDPTGKIIAIRKMGVKTAVLKFEEVSASGEYTIVVVSDMIGNFSVRATGSSDDALDEKALEEKIARTEKELAELKAKLKALKAKKKP